MKTLLMTMLIAGIFGFEARSATTLDGPIPCDDQSEDTYDVKTHSCSHPRDKGCRDGYHINKYLDKKTRTKRCYQCEQGFTWDCSVHKCTLQSS
jgi:hypothetical protein